MLSFRQWFEAELAASSPPEENPAIPRAMMPQIKSKSRDDYFKYLKKQGVTFTRQSIMPQELKPSQSDFDFSKIAAYIEDPCRTGLFDKRIIVSADNYILDGHHHWQAMLKGFPNRPIPVYKSNVNFAQLLQISHQFPKVKYQAVGVT